MTFRLDPLAPPAIIERIRDHAWGIAAAVASMEAAAAAAPLFWHPIQTRKPIAKQRGGKTKNTGRIALQKASRKANRGKR